MDLAAIHGALSFSFMLYMILAAGWNLAAAVRPQASRAAPKESGTTGAAVDPSGDPNSTPGAGSSSVQPPAAHVSSSTWGILVIGELLALLQIVVGLILAFGGGAPGRSVHWLYGATAVLTLPGYYAISRGRDDRVASFVYAGLCAFLVFIGYRAGVTGI